MTSNMIYIFALGVGFKCPRKIHLNTQCSGAGVNVYLVEPEAGHDVLADHDAGDVLLRLKHRGLAILYTSY